MRYTSPPATKATKITRNKAVEVLGYFLSIGFVL